MERLLSLYRSFAGAEPSRIEPLSVSGSHRRYFRMVGGSGGSVMGVIGTDADENKAFVTIARHFRGKGINVPEILAVSDDLMVYLQEDLGSDSLFDMVAKGREAGSYSEDETVLLVKAISGLPKIQFKGGEGLDWNICYPDREFNGRMVSFDLNYFKYCFLKTEKGLEFNEIRLQDDFDLLKADLMECRSDAFMYRDFQARNIMVRDGEPWYIDFQGGRKGPIWYDVASFIWQARSRFPSEVKERLTDAYLEALRPYFTISREEFVEKLRIFVLLRSLQILGAYGFRGRFEKKEHFLESIPAALDNLRELLQTPFARYPYLSEVLRQLAGEPAARLESKELEVRVFSFSFKRGIPEDESGNGGGYVFDCRGMHNPGRYEQYRNSTGRDADVKAFLESRGEVQLFLDNVFSLTDPHVERYISRGFSSLQVSFGCTGGQHRSVYCAEALARHLAAKYDIRVKLVHRELNLESTL